MILKSKDRKEKSLLITVWRNEAATYEGFNTQLLFVSHHSSPLFLLRLIIYQRTFSVLTCGSRPPRGSTLKSIPPFLLWLLSASLPPFHNWCGRCGDTPTFSFIHGLKAHSSHTWETPHTHTHFAVKTHTHSERRWAGTSLQREIWFFHFYILASEVNYWRCGL